VIGSSLIASSFLGPEWFHGRPDPYDPAASGATNLGPSSPQLAQAGRLAVLGLQQVEAWAGPVPADAVTGSGSGLDPHISRSSPGSRSPGWPLPAAWAKKRCWHWSIP